MANENRKSKTPASETVAKTLGLLDIFRTERTMTASEVARRAEMPLSTVFRLLNTLTTLRFLDYHKPTKTYRLGLKLLELGQLVSEQLDLPQLALPILSTLVEKSGETAHLSIRDGDEGVFVAKVEAPQSIRMHTPLGRRVPLHAGASMLSIFAFLPDHEIASYIERGKAVSLTSNTITDPDHLWKRVGETRHLGYAVSHGEQTPLAAGVGAPVYDHRNMVVAGLTISGPLHRMTPERTEVYAALITEMAAHLSARLGKL